MIQDRRIFLTWQRGQHLRRYIVGELIETQNQQYIFRYLHDGDLQEAREHGFKGYPAFPIENRDYTKNVIESFSARLPARTRRDFFELLEYWGIENKNIKDFDLLSIAGGKLATDLFQLIDPHEKRHNNQFSTELAGFVHYTEDTELRGLQKGTHLQLERETDNEHDPFAVKVFYNQNHIGYINRVHSRIISSELAQGNTVLAEVRNSTINGMVNTILLKITIENPTS